MTGPLAIDQAVSRDWRTRDRIKHVRVGLRRWRTGRTPCDGGLDMAEELLDLLDELFEERCHEETNSRRN